MHDYTKRQALWVIAFSLNTCVVTKNLEIGMRLEPMAGTVIDERNPCASEYWRVRHPLVSPLVDRATNGIQTDRQP